MVIEFKSLRTRTNEDLNGIVAGLQPSAEDSILAIAGSGDQAFALLEFAGKVETIDIFPEQIDLIKKRYNALKKRDYKGFFCIDSNSPNPQSKYDLLRYEYFAVNDNQRLDQIRQKLPRLKIAQPANTFDIIEQKYGFNKIYLSNAIGYQGNNQGNIQETLSKVAQNLPLNGLIYVTNHGDFWFEPQMNNLPSPISMEQFVEEITGSNKDLEDRSNLPPELVVDTELSLKAREYELGWSPAIYRKIA